MESLFLAPNTQLLGVPKRPELGTNAKNWKSESTKDHEDLATAAKSLQTAAQHVKCISKNWEQLGEKVTALEIIAWQAEAKTCGSMEFCSSRLQSAGETISSLEVGNGRKGCK